MRRHITSALVCLISLAISANSQQSPAVNPQPSSAVFFEPLDSHVIEQRLQSYKGNDNQREETVKTMFQSAGCSGANLTEQPVRGLKQPNVICVLPGKTESVILVGAHFDHVDLGDGVVDNWSGASLLPSLYQAIDTRPRRHTFIFVAFAGEEKGLVGSKFYVEHATPEELKRIDAMVTIDTLGLGPTEVWASRSDKQLVGYLNGTAHGLNLPLTAMNVDDLGESDEEHFIRRKVPTITIHSVTRETFHVLHNRRDNYSAVHFDNYYDSYKLLGGYLAVLDSALGTAASASGSGPQ